MPCETKYSFPRNVLRELEHGPAEFSVFAKLQWEDKQKIPVPKHEDPPWAIAERRALARRPDGVERSQGNYSKKQMTHPLDRLPRKPLAWNMKS